MRAKLVYASNHLPQVDACDEGFWSRLILLKLDRFAAESRRDFKLFDKLYEEKEGILNWMVAGFAEYQSIGLDIPDILVSGLQDFREGEDVLGRFLAEKCDRRGEVVSSSSLLDSFKKWAEQEGHLPLSAKAMKRRLSERGIQQMRTKNGVFYIGVSLRLDN